MESDDKKLYTPKYVQIEDHIISEIRNGRLKTGDRIPSEVELVRMFGVSRITVTTAIKELTARGILVRRQGKGTFVRRDDPEISEERMVFRPRRLAPPLPHRERLLSAAGYGLLHRKKRNRNRTRSWRTGSSLRIPFYAGSSVLTREAMSTRSSAISGMAGRLRRWILLISRCLYAADTPSTVRNYRPA